VRAFALALTIVFIGIAIGPRAHADETSEVHAAWAGVGAGVALMIVPPAVGGAVEANSDDINVKRGSVYLLAGGWALAPVVSHLIAREWGRAAIFGALPVAAFASIVTLLQVDPTVFNEGSVATRVSYGFMLCASAISATIGVADSLGAAGRVRRRHRALSVVPSVAPHGGGLSLGGVF
jgi:hypothetical protein